MGVNKSGTLGPADKDRRNKKKSVGAEGFWSWSRLLTT